MAAPKRYAVGPYFLGAFPLGVISITWMGQPGGVWLLAAGSSNSKGLSFDAIPGCSTIDRFDFDQLKDDFISPSSEEDPVQQIFRYVNDMRDGKYKTPKARDTLGIPPSALFHLRGGLHKQTSTYAAIHMFRDAAGRFADLEGRFPSGTPASPRLIHDRNNCRAYVFAASATDASVTPNKR